MEIYLSSTTWENTCGSYVVYYHDVTFCIFYAILMRTKKFETRLYLNSNFEKYDIELK